MPALAPNGQRLATAPWRDSQTGGVICDGSGMSFTDVEGGIHEEQSLLDQRGLTGVWSPDSARVAVFGAAGLYIVTDELDPTIMQILPSEALSASSIPVWSPDGTQFALSMRGAFDIHVVPAQEGGIPVNVTPNMNIEVNLAWSPDGTHIAFISMYRNDREIYTVNGATGEIRRVTFNSRNEAVVVWLP